MNQYAYIVGDGILGIVWLAFLFLRKDLRRQQLFVSFIIALFGPIADWLYRDYWIPESIIGLNIGRVTLRIESVIFAFLVGGIAAILYEVVFRKRHLYGKPRGALAVIIILATLVLTIILNKLGLNSIWASSFSMLLSSMVMVTIDHDLIKDAVWSSLLMMILSIILYFVWLNIYPKGFQTFWLPQALTGIKLWEIPIEEIVWFFCAGISLGIFYEFWLNVSNYPRSRKK
jgi:hypothetical protein